MMAGFVVALEPRELSTVLLIGIPVLLGVAVLLLATTVASQSEGWEPSLAKDTLRPDRSGTDPQARPDLDEEGRVRFDTTKQSLEPPAAPRPVRQTGGLIRIDTPADPEALGVTRRQFFNRATMATLGLVLASFGSAVLAFLWPARSGGFGGKIRGGPLDDILESIQEKKEPFYIPAARSYINPYPKSALAEAKKVYSESLLPGMEAGVVALFQRCPHLGCRVPWCQTSQWFECPCHGSKYNRVGEKKSGPAPRGMDRFPVEIAEGDIVINTGIVVQGPPIGTNTTGQEAEGPSCV
jgi:cytochrome b6-f complex iron-sulfur subunit